jgi:hypothetical protein
MVECFALSPLTDPYRLVGIYTGRVLKGAEPANLPVIQSTKFASLPPISCSDFRTTH